MPTVEWNRARWTDDMSEREGGGQAYYGAHWGDPEESRLRYWCRHVTQRRPPPGYLKKILDSYLRAYLRPEHTVLEIGPGGGRWTKYLLPASKVYAVDVSDEFFPVLQDRFPEARDKLSFYRTKGTEIDAVANEEIDFVFSFGCFVHIEPAQIDEYFTTFERVMKPGAIATIQYADKRKKRARRQPNFSDMVPSKMEALVAKHGFTLLEHDTRVLAHSSVAVFRK